jgi:hypothetical protein
MKRLTIFALAMATGLAVAGCGDDDNGPNGPGNTGPIVFTVQLSAANEVPAITNSESGGRGTATITFNVPRDSAGIPTGGGSAVFSVQLSGFPAGSMARAAHIHPGAAGANGPVLVDTGLTAAAPVLLSDGTGNITLTSPEGQLTQERAAQIVANPAGFYFNVHTPVNPGGAVRGQLVRQQ